MFLRTTYVASKKLFWINQVSAPVRVRLATPAVSDESETDGDTILIQVRVFNFCSIQRMTIFIWSIVEWRLGREIIRRNGWFEIESVHQFVGRLQFVYNWIHLCGSCQVDNECSRQEIFKSWIYLNENLLCHLFGRFST